MAIARMGGAGLTTFFVLSGFLLSHVYADQLRDGLTRQAYWKFLWARFARV
jgi:peptidoglycan/LPS O-acetylase OafA/YrhL